MIQFDDNYEIYVNSCKQTKSLYNNIKKGFSAVHSQILPRINMKKYIINDFL